MIEFSHAYKVFRNGHRALRDISFEIEKGEFVFLAGPSGAGKSTLFRLISAFDRASSGHVSVLGRNLSQLKNKDLPRFRRQIGVVYQDFRLLKDRTVFENVALPLLVRGDRAAALNKRVRDTLERVGLENRAEAFADELSGGEQQRVAIARALIHQPGVLVADEPTGNLDHALSDQIFSLLESVNAQGTTVFVATHDEERIRRKSHRVIELRAGQLASQDSGQKFGQSLERN